MLTEALAAMHAEMQAFREEVTGIDPGDVLADAVPAALSRQQIALFRFTVLQGEADVDHRDLLQDLDGSQN